MRNILVIDDEIGDKTAHSKRYSQSDFLRDYATGRYSFSFSTALDHRSGEYSLDAVRRVVDSMPPIDAVLLDVRFGDQGRFGLSLLPNLVQEYPSIPIIMMTDVPREEIIEECYQLGSVDFLPKGFKCELLWQTLDRYAGARPQDWLIGQSDGIFSCIEQITGAARAGASSVLLLGESGSGKGHIARFLHRHGRRWNHPFVHVDLATIPETLMEAELFGSTKGSFTGAIASNPGRLVQADQGVLFLDEIGNISEGVQKKLLHFLDTHEVQPVGGGRARRIDVQVVSATNSNLPARVRHEQFRLDLYSRLSTFVVHLPPLRARVPDIPMLFRHMLLRAAIDRNMGPGQIVVPDSFEADLCRRLWPANLRDLSNLAQRALDLSWPTPPAGHHFARALEFSDVEFESSDGPSIGSPISNFPQVRRSPCPQPLLPVISESVLTNPAAYIEGLVLQELALLQMAIEYTRDRVSGQANRAKAAALLLGRKRASTNQFDRWAQRLMDRLEDETAEKVRILYPDLNLEIPAKAYAH